MNILHGYKLVRLPYHPFFCRRRTNFQIYLLNIYNFLLNQLFWSWSMLEYITTHMYAFKIMCIHSCNDYRFFKFFPFSNLSSPFNLDIIIRFFSTCNLRYIFCCHLRCNIEPTVLCSYTEIQRNRNISTDFSFPRDTTYEPLKVRRYDGIWSFNSAMARERKRERATVHPPKGGKTS